MPDGTTYEIDIPVKGGPDAASASTACLALADSLERAGQASTAAAEAMRAGEKAYRVAETTADRAAKAHEKVTAALEAQRAALTKASEDKDEKGQAKAAKAIAALVERQREAEEASKRAAAALALEATNLDKLRAASKAAEATQKAAASAAAKAAGTGNIGKLKGSLRDLGGPVGDLGSRAAGLAATWENLSEAVGSAGPFLVGAGAIAAVVAAVVALSAAAVIGVAKVAAWAVTLADAGRSQRLLADGIAGTVGGGAALARQFDYLSKTIPLTREELASIAQNLRAAGTSAEDLPKALETAAEQAARVKFGPNFEKELVSLRSSSARLGDNFSKLFGQLKIDKLLDGLSRLVDLFDETSDSGRAIKVVFESIFQPIADGVTGLIPIVERGFLKFEIIVLKALIAIKPFGSTIVLFAEALGVLAALIVGVVAVSFAIFIAPLVAIVAILAGVIAGVIWLTGALSDLASTVSGGVSSALTAVFDWLSTISLVDIGAALIQGLADGITGGASAVLSSVQGAVTGAIDHAKELLGIASPSRVFAEIGAHTAEGMAQGVDGGAPDVGASLENLVSPPALPAASGGGAPAALPPITIQVFAPSGDGESIAAAVRRAVLELFESDLAQLGGMAAP